MLSLWIFFQLLGLLEAYHWSGNTMYDLEYQGSSFDSEAGPWIQSGYWTNYVKTSTCDGNRIMGGYKVLGGTSKGGYWQRVYTGIPTPHNVVYLTIRIYPIDAWDYDEDDHFELWFDGFKIIAWAFEGYDNPYSNTNICGNLDFKDLKPMWVYATVPHTLSTLTFRVVNSLNYFPVAFLVFRTCRKLKILLLLNWDIKFSDNPISVMKNQKDFWWCNERVNQNAEDESLGFREITMDFQQIPNPPSTFSFCGITAGNPLNYNACPCAAGTYMYPPSSGICLNCDPTCTTCTGGGSPACLTCPDGRYKVGNTCPKCDPNCQTCTGSATNCLTCPTVNPYMVGTTCYPTCSYPLYTQVVGVVTYCRTPCSGTYAWWDGSCGPCTYTDTYGEVFTLQPVTVNTFLQCNYPCGSQILYFNTSCLSTCPSPLTPITYKSRSFCGYSCSPSAVPAQYLYWNGSCINTCPWPLSPEVQGTVAAYQRNFCWYYCQPGEYMYWNGSCIATCPPPLTPEIQGTNPTRKFCWYTCAPTQYLYWNGSCSSVCPWPLTPETQGTDPTYKRNFCWYTCAPIGFLYWNGTCSSVCPWPLIPETQGTNLPRQFCWYLCSPNQFLYWNGSCINTCPWPLSPGTQGSVTFYQRKFCWYYCQPNEFMYWNGSCISTCPWPLVQEVQGTDPSHLRNFYWYLCQPSQYLYWNGSCLNSCPWPLSPETQGTDPTYKRNFCWYYCQPNEFLYWNGSCIADCASPLAQETQGTYLSRQFCWYLCQPNQYLYWNLSCINSCPAPLTPEMQGTIPQYQRNFCWYTCQPNQFLLWNYTCSDTCPYPLTNEIQGTHLSRKFCWYPCMPHQWLNWDQTCQPACNFPLASETQGAYLPRQFCWYYCQPDEFMYWNGLCLSTCPPPFTTEIQGTNPTRKFCWHSCQSGQILLSDGSCVDSCPSGSFENEALNSCVPCQDSLCSVCSPSSSGAKCQQCKDPYILNSNDLCQDCQALKNQYINQDDETYTYQYKLTFSPESCNLDEIAVKQYLLPTQDTKNRFPPFSFQVNQAQDSTGAKYFLLEIQFESAISSDSLMNFALSSLQTDLQVPKSPESPESLPEPTQSTADNGVKTTFAAVTGSTIGAGLTLGATAALWSIINFQQFVGYFIYLNVQLPPHLIYFLTMFDNINLEIIPNPLASLTNRLAELWDSLVNNNDPKYQLPHKFTEFDTPTLFVINAGSTFFVGIILLLVPYLFDLLRKFKPLTNIKFIQNLHSSLRWNIPIRIFLESGIPLTFALLIQMRKISYSNVPYGISTVTASLAFIYLAMMINYISQALRDFKYEDLENPSVEKSIGTLFEGLVLKKEKPSGKYYYLLILLRGMLLVSVDVLADQFPIVQTTVMAVFNLYFVYFVWVIIKFKSRYLNWTNRIKEVLILVVEVFFMTLCYQQNERYRNIVGWLIISVLGLSLAMELLFGFYLQVLAIIDFVKWIREYCRKKKKVLVIAPTLTEETSRNFTIET